MDDTRSEDEIRPDGRTAPVPGADARGRVAAFDGAILHAALAMATRAPSIHNSQPWLWRTGPHGLELHADPTRRLQRTDPVGRDQVISCGAALHHLLVALAANGQGARVHRLPDPARPDHMATVEPAADVDPDVDAALAAAIPRRHTDRRPFRPWPVPPELIGELAEIADRQGIGVSVVVDPRVRRRLFRAIELAAGRQETDPAYADELAAWSGRPAGTPDGVPADRAPVGGRVPGRMPMRALRGEPRPEASGGEPESAALLLLSTPTDTPLQWLRVGEVTSAILLTASRYRLATSPLTQPLEVGETRAFIRDHVITGTAHPQMLLRVGWPRPGVERLPPTPRRSVAEVATGLPMARRRPD
jgi:hypothetical protein